jgi:hypothetical protein
MTPDHVPGHGTDQRIAGGHDAGKAIHAVNPRNRACRRRAGVAPFRTDDDEVAGTDGHDAAAADVVLRRAAGER